LSLYFSNHGKQYDSKLVLNKKKHILISKQKRDKKKKACFTKKIRYNPKTKMQNSKVPQQNDCKYNTLLRLAFPNNICVSSMFTNHLLCWIWFDENMIDDITFHKINLSLSHQFINLIFWNSCDFKLSGFEQR